MVKDAKQSGVIADNTKGSGMPLANRPPIKPKNLI